MKFDTTNDNAGGLMRLAVIFPENYEGVINTTKNRTVLLFTDYTAAIFFPVTHDGYSFSETLNTEEVGMLYDTVISGIVPGNTSDINRLINQLASRKYWIVVVFDANGNIISSGDKDFPMSFTYEQNTGASRDDFNGFSFTFTHKSPYESTAIDVINYL